MLSIYFKVVLLFVSLIFIFGFALPFLISAKSTELVLIGFVTIISITPFLVGLSINIFKNINKIKKEKISNENA